MSVTFARTFAPAARRRTLMSHTIFGGASSVSEVAPMDDVIAHVMRP